MLFVGCLLLGLGLGLLLDEVAAGTLIGLGIGFIVAGVLNRLEPWLKAAPRRRDKV